jgi:methyltransferase
MDPHVALALAAAAVVVQRAAELRLARRNERWARSRGALEHGAAHYPAFFVLHAGWFAGWLLEAGLRGPAVAAGWPVWLSLLAAAEALRYWAIASLGQRWNTRILVLPGEPPVRRGPYRYLRHPNYLAVAVELAVVPLLFDAWITALAASLLNAALLVGVRIPAEERALRP